MRLRCVCFDLGGVLVQIHHTWDGAMAAAGVQSPLTDKQFGDLLAFDGLSKLHAERWEELEYFAELAKFLGGVSVEDARRVHAAILQDPYPGTLEFIEELKASSLKVAGLSNTNWSHVDEMVNSGRFPNVTALDRLLTSCEARLNKPDLAIYEYFEREMGVSGPEILFFDDLEANVIAAEEMGWRAVRISPSGEPSTQMREALAALASR